MFDASLPSGLKAFAEREFVGERLVWAARPDRRMAALASFGIWVFAIPWTAFALFWISVPGAALLEAYAGVNIGAPKGAPVALMWAFALFGVPFALIGFGMLLAPVAVIRKGRRTLYVLTNRRLAVLEDGFRVTVTNIMPGDISGFARKEGPDGRGTLIVSQGYEKDSEGGKTPKTTELGVIEGVRKVEDLVRGLAGSRER
jgi:hypothetical protein